METWLSKAVRIRCKRRVIAWVCGFSCLLMFFVPLCFVSDFNSGDYIAVIAIFVIMGFLFFKYGWPCIGYLNDCDQHPLIKSYGASGQAINLIIDAMHESEAPLYRSRGGGWMVTKNFFIRNAFFTFDLIPISHLVWAYKCSTKERINWIHMHTSHSAVLECKGGTAWIYGNEKYVDGILYYLVERAPWARFGYP